MWKWSNRGINLVTYQSQARCRYHWVRSWKEGATNHRTAMGNWQFFWERVNVVLWPLLQPLVYNITVITNQFNLKLQFTLNWWIFKCLIQKWVSICKKNCKFSNMYFKSTACNLQGRASGCKNSCYLSEIFFFWNNDRKKIKEAISQAKFTLKMDEVGDWLKSTFWWMHCRQ